MILTDLTLTNFRSFKKKSLSFFAKTTVIVGANTVGKTNILEAIYLLATGKSFRAEEEKEIISYGEEITRVGGVILSESEGSLANASLEIVLTTGSVGGQIAPRKKYLVNGVAKRMIDFLGNLRAVLFWPEDLLLVTDSPSVRRKYLDNVLCQTDREYSRCLLAYEKGVRQRNKLLERIRDEGLPGSQLTFWNQLLIKNGGVLTEKREEYIGFINKQNVFSGRHAEFIRRKALLISASKRILKQVQNDNGQVQDDDKSLFSIEYDKSIISENRLEQYAQNEIGAAMTLVGPHRDDVKFEIRSSTSSGSKSETPRDLSLYGSRGEQRMAVFWLKLGELEFMAQKTGERPILLLDDIFSELDKRNIRLIGQIGLIGNQQTIMTTTDLHLIDQKFLKSAKIIEL